MPRPSIRSIIRKVADPILQPFARHILYSHGVPRRLDTRESAHRNFAGLYLRSLYPELAHPAACKTELNRHELSSYSNCGEDGILMYLFSKIGVTDRRAIEFGIEDGTECNAANLIFNFGFSGLLIDGDTTNVAYANAFYESILQEEAKRARIVQSWITTDNINQLFEQNGYTGEIDLLSIDIDGNDYWVWDSITVVQPRLVVIEYNSIFGPKRSITIPYQPDFNRWEAHPSGLYCGASLKALTKLGEARGYVLVGGESAGMNAFFVREDVLAKTDIPAASIDEAYFAIDNQIRRGQSIEKQFGDISGLPFVEI